MDEWDATSGSEGLEGQGQGPGGWVGVRSPSRRPPCRGRPVPSSDNQLYGYCGCVVVPRRSRPSSGTHPAGPCTQILTGPSVHDDAPGPVSTTVVGASDGDGVVVFDVQEYKITFRCSLRIHVTGRTPRR